MMGLKSVTYDVKWKHVVLRTLCSLKKRSTSSLSPPAQLTSRWRSWSTGRSFWKMWLPWQDAKQFRLSM